MRKAIYDSCTALYKEVFLLAKKEVRVLVSDHLYQTLNDYHIRSGYTKAHIVRIALLLLFKERGLKK